MQLSRFLENTENKVQGENGLSHKQWKAVQRPRTWHAGVVDARPN